MKRIRHSISEDQYKTLITHVTSDITLKEHSRIKLLRTFHILYYTGLRINEVTLISIGKLKSLIENEGGTVYTPKKDKERQLYLSDNACKTLKKVMRFREGEEDHHLILSSWNKPTTAMHPQAVTRLVNEYMKKVLGAGFTSHSFRQGIITDMFAAQVATKVIQEFIGHSDAATTLRYDRPTETRIKEALIR